MGRVDFDEFGDKDIRRIYLAARLTEAKQVEAVLVANNLDYAVAVERYVTISPFDSGSRAGAAFYVEAEKADFCRTVLLAAGLGIGIVDQIFSCLSPVKSALSQSAKERKDLTSQLVRANVARKIRSGLGG